jgi:hypothetical protein
MHIYAFGSLCRGEVDLRSDIDLLAIVDGYDPRIGPTMFSIYSYRRIGEIWSDGNPFAWHLSLESRLIFAGDGDDVIVKLGKPSPYRACLADCERFQRLFVTAWDSLLASEITLVFDLSTIFLSIRNFASCYSLGMMAAPTFGRRSALELGAYSVPLDARAYDVLERARILSTRGYGAEISKSEAAYVISLLENVQAWMNGLTERIKRHE